MSSAVPGLLAADAIFQPGLLGAALLFGTAGLVAFAAAAPGAIKDLPATAVPAMQAQLSPQNNFNSQKPFNNRSKMLGSSQMPRISVKS